MPRAAPSSPPSISAIHKQVTCSRFAKRSKTSPRTLHLDLLTDPLTLSPICRWDLNAFHQRHVGSDPAWEELSDEC